MTAHFRFIITNAKWDIIRSGDNNSPQIYFVDAIWNTVFID
jgi:hypothetical protein